MVKTEVFDSIDETPKGLWNAILQNRSLVLSHEFWEVVERSGLNDFRYRHVIFRDDNGNPVGLTSFYSITTDIAIFAPARLRWLLAAVRKFFPNFLKLRMLECGTPITLCSPPFAAAPATPDQEIVSALEQLLRDTAREEGQWFIVIRDFEPEAEALRAPLQARGYHWVDNLPNAYLNIAWRTPAEYMAALKSYYRSKLQGHLRKNQARGIRHELVDDFGHLADRLCAQWRIVHDQADEFQREVLTPGFYRELSAGMGGRAKALLFYRDTELVGHALLLQDHDMLRWLYFGREEACNDSLYLYVAHAVIETAIQLGAKRLEMGLTTYSIKQDMGAHLVPLKMALRATSGLINPFVGWCYPLLNRPPEIRSKSVFKHS